MSSFVLFYGWVAFQCIDVPDSLHFSVSGHFGGFCVLAIVNSAALKIKVHASFWMMIFSGPKLRNGIAGSYNTSVSSVSRKLHAVFHHGFTVYIPTKTVGGFYFLYLLCSNCSLPLFPMMAIVTSARWDLIVLFGIDLIITDVDYLFHVVLLLFYILWEQLTSSIWLL